MKPIIASRQAPGFHTQAPSLVAFSIPKAIQKHSQQFETAICDEANNNDLPEFMKEMYRFGLNGTTR